MSHSLIASSSSSSKPQTIYDVFLSFSGDTRKKFTSHLYKALDEKGIYTFMDEEELQKGTVISPELEKAIKGSHCSVVILSRGYASSRWCLDELVLILQCMKDWKQIVLPIFYDVDPAHVRKQIGSIGDAFKRHEQVRNLEKVKSWWAALTQIGSIGDAFKSHEQVPNLEKVKSWRAALTEVGNLAGYHLQDDGNEAKFIEDFIKVVSSNLDVPNILKDLIGIHSRLKELESCVSSSPDVRFIGICGMGGLGKTTLARAYFDYMFSQFEARSFLANIREVCENNMKEGLVKLQKQLLTDILKGEHDISNVDQGIGMIQTRLCGKKVLVILDDVDQLKQLEGLAEKNHWFGSGSRIILTTRDESLLRSIYKKEGCIIHKVDKLKNSEALHLFSLKAFKSDCPAEDYQVLSEKVVEYAKGLPLALEVLGSFLGTCESIDEWESALERLKKYPEEDIMKTLQISFDALKDTEKNIFLDIACFFNGQDKDYIMEIMDACGFFPKIGIRSLVDKSLLHMDHDGFGNTKLRMHDLLEEMGKEIVRKESPNEPGRQSRIWLWDDLIHVMNNDTATEEVKAIVCRRSCREQATSCSLRGFSIMKKLRLLIVYSRSLWCGKNLEHLSNELRFLKLDGFPFDSFPPSFQPHGLVELKLQESKIKQLWNDPRKPLKNLKSIDLSYSKIKKLEGFKSFPNVEKLILGHSMLEEIDPSITVLKRLTLLSLEECRKLKSLPTSMNGLESLKVLKLRGCKMLGKLPEDLGCLKNLEVLEVQDTGIRDIPSSIGDLKALKSLDCFKNFLGSHRWKNILNGLSSAGLCSLKELYLGNCRLCDGAFPDDFGGLVSLEYLHLGWNSFSCLPAHFNRLSKLTYLHLGGCGNLTSLGPELPNSLRDLELSFCGNLTSLGPELPNSLRDLNLTGCENLTSLGPELPNSLESVTVDYCRKLPAFLDPLSQWNLRCSAISGANCLNLVNRQGGKRTAITSLGRYLQNCPSPSKRFDIFLPGYEIPSWFTCQVRESSSISLPLHPNWCTNEWMGFALSVCFAGSVASYNWEIKMNQEGRGFEDVTCAGNFIVSGRHHWLLYLPRTYFPTEWHNKLGDIQFSFKCSKSGFSLQSGEFKQCGVRMVYEQDIQELNLTATHEPIELEPLELEPSDDDSIEERLDDSNDDSDDDSIEERDDDFD